MSRSYGRRHLGGDKRVEENKARVLKMIKVLDDVLEEDSPVKVSRRKRRKPSGLDRH